jgi:hypothetical protein
MIGGGGGAVWTGVGVEGELGSTECPAENFCTRDPLVGISVWLVLGALTTCFSETCRASSASSVNVLSEIYKICQ